MAQTAQQTISPKTEAAIILRAKGLRKSFRMGDTRIEVLKSVDLTIRQGEFIAIEGRSGSGKSTLLHLLGALDEADSGSIEFDGRDISTLGSTARSHLRNTQFGFVFQFYHLLPELNVLENTLLGPMIEYSWLSFRSHRSELRKRAVALLVQLGLEHRLKHKPSQISGGERQRVAIARALMNSPRVLFADEPTGNLDADTGRQIMSVLERLHRESAQTIIMVTHDRSLARQADRTLILKEGKLDRPADSAAPASAATA
ncbi:MAG: ABC transporter ATP-binding protein [Phycisphaerales bacterium]|nr:ABC transporter ATP-binding protein [Phycisphaerales bacterium]